jgi:purine-binding chemotaxis protein CheW
MPTLTKEVQEQQQYLTFLLAGEEYAIGILNVKEIIEYDTVTTVPKAPKWIRGVFNLRGNVVPVVDLAVKFGLEERPVSKTTCIIIVEGALDNTNATMGVIADAVSHVMDISAEEIQAVPAFGTRIKVDYLLGMAQLGKKFALVLDMNKLLSTDELLDLSAVRPGEVRDSASRGDAGSVRGEQAAQPAFSIEKTQTPA